MGLLSHPCTSTRPDGSECGRSELSHGPVWLRSLNNRCPRYERGETPLVVETYIAPSLKDGGTMILDLTPPGTPWPAASGKAEKTCACTACHTAFVREGGVAADCRCRPCAIAHRDREAADAPTFDMADDMGPVYLDDTAHDDEADRG